MKRYQNLILLGVVVLLALIPLWLVQKPAADADGKQAEIFEGADNKEMSIKDRPWAGRSLPPPSLPTASMP